MSGDLKQLIAREQNAIQQQIRGRVMSDPVQKNFDVIGLAEFTWVVDVDIGSDKLLRDVPVKINGPKARFYARVDQSVFLEKDAQGRYQVIRPADRVRQQGRICFLDEDDGIVSPTVPLGFDLIVRPYEFYKGNGLPGGSFYNDGVHGYPEITKLDQDGNEV
ncbi:MAG: hypothetical protein V3T84_00060 [Phycisphaerales bacterium]